MAIRAERIETIIQAHQLTITEKLNKIENIVNLYGEISNPHYGHVGDLARVNSDLDDLLGFLQYQPVVRKDENGE